MKLGFHQLSSGESVELLPSLVSSSSSEDLSAFEGFRSEAGNSEQVQVSRRRSRSGSRSRSRGQILQRSNLGGSFPTAYTSNLQQILTRFHNWSTALTLGNTGISKKALGELQHRIADREHGKQQADQVCTLCLECILPGEEYTVLSCGHAFHKGSAHVHTGNENCECRGILYWLKSNLTCPQCRTELEPAVPVPTQSEQVIVPLLNRQFALIQAQARLIERQRRDLQSLQQTVQRNLERNTGSSATQGQRKRKRSVDESSAKVYLPSSVSAEPQPMNRSSDSSRQASGSGLTTGQWQDGVEHHVHRVHILNRVTKIAVSALNWRLAGCSVSKVRKLNTLAAKVELLLFSEAASLEEYKNMATLRKRVLKKIRGLIWKAKALRRVRHGNHTSHANHVTPVGSLVF